MNLKSLFTMIFQIKEEEDVLVMDAATSGSIAHIVVYNDDYNTFDWVIKCFMEILDHTEQQAEQSALIIHFKGKSSVKTGSLDTLRPLKNALVERGLSAVIEEEQIES